MLIHNKNYRLKGSCYSSSLTLIVYSFSSDVWFQLTESGTTITIERERITFTKEDAMCKTCAAHNPPKTAGKPVKKGTTKKK
jgi:hypothetical protein